MQKTKNAGKHKQLVIQGATFINRTTNEEIKGDLIGHDEIDGKGFFVVQVGARAMKFSKEGYELKRRNR